MGWSRERWWRRQPALPTAASYYFKWECSSLTRGFIYFSFCLAPLLFFLPSLSLSFFYRSPSPAGFTLNVECGNYTECVLKEEEEEERPSAQGDDGKKE